MCRECEQECKKRIRRICFWGIYLPAIIRLITKFIVWYKKLEEEPNCDIEIEDLIDDDDDAVDVDIIEEPPKDIVEEEKPKRGRKKKTDET